ncbi:MAG: hypothetical protein HYZ58_19250 [Acidobacteria bacterium]|nr:hypothetical protein [Acidobacteriota bacterium]
MVYKSQHLASHREQFDEWIEFAKSAQYDRHSVIGLGAFMNSLENTIVQIGAARAPSVNGSRARGLNFFSYNSTNDAITGVPLRPQDEFFRALSEDGAYAVEASFATSTGVPAMDWKTEPRKGHLLVEIRDRDGRAADGAQVMIVKRGAVPGDEAAVQYADGNGYAGGVDLDPGVYQLVIALPGDLGELVTVPRPVAGGRVTRVRVDLRRPWRGPVPRSEHVLSADERTDRLTETSAIKEWRTREPVPDDILVRRAVRPPK